MPITIDTERQAQQAQTMLAKLSETTEAGTVTDEEISNNQSDLAKDHARLRECRDNQRTAREQIATLRKAMEGWEQFLAYQERREPALERRYELKRDWIRAAEDEQTGN